MSAFDLLTLTHVTLISNLRNFNQVMEPEIAIKFNGYFTYLNSHQQNRKRKSQKFHLN